MRSVAVVRYESSFHSFLDHGSEQHVPSNMLTEVKNSVTTTYFHQTILLWLQPPGKKSELSP